MAVPQSVDDVFGAAAAAELERVEAARYGVSGRGQAGRSEVASKTLFEGSARALMFILKAGIR